MFVVIQILYPLHMYMWYDFGILLVSGTIPLERELLINMDNGYAISPLSDVSSVDDISSCSLLCFPFILPIIDMISPVMIWSMNEE